jgi:hypothetical protein
LKFKILPVIIETGKLNKPSATGFNNGFADIRGILKAFVFKAYMDDISSAPSGTVIFAY